MGHSDISVCIVFTLKALRINSCPRVFFFLRKPYMADVLTFPVLGGVEMGRFPGLSCQLA